MHELINPYMKATMDRRIDAHIARTQFGQIMDRATRNNDRFIVDRRGVPTIVILSVGEFRRIAAPPTRLAGDGVKRRQTPRARSVDVVGRIAAGVAPPKDTVRPLPKPTILFRGDRLV